jgi:hypothetical protein
LILLKDRIIEVCGFDRFVDKTRKQNYREVRGGADVLGVEGEGISAGD